jgi:hypothetical protein
VNSIYKDLWRGKDDIYSLQTSNSLSDIFLNTADKAALSGSHHCGEVKTTARLANMYLICAATRLRIN